MRLEWYFSEKVQQALRILRQALSFNRPIVLLFSGGKDSLVCLDLCYHYLRPKNFSVVYVEVTGNTHPLSRDQALKTLQSYGVNYYYLKSPNFWNLFHRYGYPFLPMVLKEHRRGIRWCLKECKQRVWESFIKDKVVVSGIKASDRPIRKQIVSEGLIREVHYYRYTEFIDVMPIGLWSDDDVWEYIEREGLKKYLDPCYKLTGGSENCVFCFFMGKSKFKKLLTVAHHDSFCKQVVSKFIEIHFRLKTREKQGLDVGVKKIYEHWDKLLSKLLNQQLLTNFM